MNRLGTTRCLRQPAVARTCLLAPVCAALMLTASPMAVSAPPASPATPTAARLAHQYPMNMVPSQFAAVPGASQRQQQVAVENSLPGEELYPQIAASAPVCGVQCDPNACSPEPGWDVAGPIPWEVFAQGEYVGPSRLPHVPVYRLRADDQVEFVYRITAQRTDQPYRFQTGDLIRIQSLSAQEIGGDALVQPDGMVALPLLGQVLAAGLTFEQLRQSLEAKFKQFVNDPRIAITPIKIDTRLQELRSTIDNRAGVVGGQSIQIRVSPDGTVQLPAIGSVPANGLTLAELKREIDHRYGTIVEGIEITPILTQRAPRYVYVLGEVAVPGRYPLEGPTTLMQVIALAGSWNVGAHLRDIVVFRRDENWRLMATKLDIRGALYAKRPCPADEIWIRDSDIVVVPKHPVRVADDIIELVFIRGIYGMMPFVTTLDWSDL